MHIFKVSKHEELQKLQSYVHKKYERIKAAKFASLGSGQNQGLNMDWSWLTGTLRRPPVVIGDIFGGLKGLS